jgi:hypothetical protein
MATLRYARYACYSGRTDFHPIGGHPVHARIEVSVERQLLFLA